MKKFTLILLMAGFAFGLNAQTSKNDVMIGGNLKLNTAKNNTNFTLKPSVGYFFADNLAFGGNIGLGYSKIGDTKSTNFNIGPFARYYFTTETQTVRPFAHFEFNYLTSNIKIPSLPTVKSNGINYLLAGGAAFFINENVSVDALLGYDHTKLKGSDGDGGLNFSVGFQVFINKATINRLKNNN